MATVEQRIAQMDLDAALPSPSAVPLGRIERFEALLNVVERACDVGASALAILAAVATYEGLHLGKDLHYPTRVVFVVALAFGLLFMLLLDRDGAYSRGNSLMRIKETERVLRLSALAASLSLPLAYFTGHAIPRWVFVLSLAFVPVALIVVKQLFYTVVRKLHSFGIGVRRVVIYGAGYSGLRVFAALKRSPKLGLMPVAIVDDDPARVGTSMYEPGYQRRESVPIIAGPVTSELLRSYSAGLLVLAIPRLEHARFSRLINEAKAAGADFAFVPGRTPGSDHVVSFVNIDGLLLASYGAEGSPALGNLLKRSFDLFVASLLLVWVMPLWALIAAMLRLDSRGPIFFVQQRIGKNGRPFSLYKFRSMYVDAPAYACSPKDGRDPRITRVGRFLRRTSLDELPQLLNVLKGDMSLVGPRPEMPFLVQRYTPRQRHRLVVTPGITGLWQISADRAFLIHENIQYDLYYIRNQGFFLDLAILLHTALFAMRGV